MTDRSVITVCIMSTPARRRKEARPAELLEAALDEIAEHGFSEARMEDIARRAGVSKGTVYLYFPGKQALFEALVRHALLPRLEALSQQLETGGLSSRAQLRLMLSRVQETMLDPRILAIPRLVIAESQRFPDVARFYKQTVIDRGLGPISALLSRGVEQGEFRPHDTNLVARLVVAPVLKSLIWRNTFEGPTGDILDVPALLSLHLDLLFRALAPEPAAPDRVAAEPAANDHVESGEIA
jgi:AcrR family transcriptional regulator